MVEIQNVKKVVQQILDKYIEPKKRFSVQDLDDEDMYLLINILLEKDDSKREKLWDEFGKKIKLYQMNLRVDYESANEIKDILDFQKVENTDLIYLKDVVKIDQEMKDKLNTL